MGLGSQHSGLPFAGDRMEALGKSGRNFVWSNLRKRLGSLFAFVKKLVEHLHGKVFQSQKGRGAAVSMNQRTVRDTSASIDCCCRRSGLHLGCGPGTAYHAQPKWMHASRKHQRRNHADGGRMSEGMTRF